MKKLLITLTLFTALAASAQQFQPTGQWVLAGTLKSNRLLSSYVDRNNVKISTEIYGLDGSWPLTHYKHIDGRDIDSLVVRDSARAIEAMMYFIETTTAQQEKEREIKYAAENILRYITTDGRVSNRKRFNEAVKKYQQTKAKYK